ncbi:hypothetical protein KY362_06145 [Candidatus Woesearchaeota archaeon]|nr:hypothetical protein [Candidatus Woesearchaeota archaeon]
MKIEIDTRNDSKEDLALLADMLRKLGASPSSSLSSSSTEVFGSASDARLQRKLARRGLLDDIPSSQPATAAPANSSSPSASGGLFSLFSDGPEEPAGHVSSPAPIPQAGAGDIFSMFNSDPEPSSTVLPSAESAPTASSFLSGSPSSASSPLELLQPLGELGSAEPANMPEESEDEGKSAQELLDDDRIVPY